MELLSKTGCNPISRINRKVNTVGYSISDIPIVVKQDLLMAVVVLAALL
jgi:hypothetical protein